MILSPGHSVFCGGVLIPIEHLINGATVVQEKRASVDYFHIELDRHDVVLAEGLPVESYLEDGNRAAFDHGSEAPGASPTMLHPDFRPRGWHNACTPRCIQGQPLIVARRLLHERALALGYRIATEGGLCLLADGAPLTVSAADMPAKRGWRKGTPYCVKIPMHVREMHVTTRATVPVWIDPASEDRRPLGVRITAVCLGNRAVPLHSRLFGTGFYPIERLGSERWRWTAGEALLRIPPGGARKLELLVRDFMRCWHAPEHSSRRQAA